MPQINAVPFTATNSRLAEFRKGWPILIAAMLGCGLGVSSLPLYTAGVFMPHLQGEFGWSRTELSTAVLIFTMALAAASPLVGRLIDKLGVRTSAAISISAAALCYLILATQLASLATFYLLQAAIAAMGAAAAPVAYTRVVTSHFHRSRGLALGITLLGPSLAATIAPAALTSVIASHGWAVGYLSLALMTSAMLPFLLLLKPSTDKENQPSQHIAAEETPLFSAAERKRIFYRLLGGLALFSLGIGGLLVHLVPLLIDSGLDPIKAASIAGLIGISGMIGRLAGGALADRLFAPYVLVGISAVAAFGCMLLATLGAAAAAPAAVALGFALGAEADLMGYLVARYFGKRAYGKIFGWQYAAFISGIGLSPMLLGYAYDATHSYSMALMINVALLLAALLTFLRLPRFRDAF
ncbi:MFS transporter [Pseudomonas putida]|uniref:MFS transporter n=1 Tax=Pseudomonas TaxID=286 RepID=UPI001376C3AA|nr:MFS transporter [Pseudomonas putida]NBA79222.1 MFS transporter [Pseudomonas putida]